MAEHENVSRHPISISADHEFGLGIKKSICVVMKISLIDHQANFFFFFFFQAVNHIPSRKE